MARERIARTLGTKLQVSLIATHEDYTDLSRPIDRLVWPAGGTGTMGPGNPLLELVFGDGVGENNIVWHDNLVVEADTDREIDLTAVPIDKFGGLLTFTEIKMLVVYNHSATDPLHVLGTAALGDQITTITTVGAEAIVVPPKSFVMLGTPGGTWAIAPGADILHLDSLAVDVECDVIIIGVGTRGEDEPTTTTEAPTTTTAAPTTTT